MREELVLFSQDLTMFTIYYRHLGAILVPIQAEVTLTSEKGGGGAKLEDEKAERKQNI